MKLPKNILENYIPRNGAGHDWLQIMAVIVASLGSISTGALMAWTSPSIPILISHDSYIEPITIEEASYFTVIPPVAAILFSPIIGLLVDTIGRKKTLMLLAIFYFTSWIVIGFAENLMIFYLGRVFEGIGDATLFTVVPMYIGEVTQPKVRAAWGNLIALFGFVGQFLINIIGSFCDIKTTAFILTSVPLLQLLLLFMMPESPYFFLMKKKYLQAKTSLKMLRWKEDVEDEFNIFSKNVQQQIVESGTYKDLLFIPTNRKTLLIGIGIRAAQQFSGIPAFFMYTQYIFQQSGNNLSASVAAMIFSGVFTLVLTIFSFFASRFGRKHLMIFSCAGCSVILAIEAIYFYINEKTTIDASGVTWIPLAGMMMYIPACGVGLAIIPTLMLGELFAPSVKGKAMCCINICFSLFILIVGKLFPTLSINFGMYLPFIIFSLCCLINVAFSYFCIPETKGKTLEEIQISLKGEQKYS